MAYWGRMLKPPGSYMFALIAVVVATGHTTAALGLHLVNEAEVMQQALQGAASKSPRVNSTLVASHEQDSSAIPGTWHTTVAAVVLLGLILIGTTPVLLKQGPAAFMCVLSYIACLCLVKVCVKDVFMHDFKFPYFVTSAHMLFTSIFASLIDRPRLDEGRKTFLVSAVKAASLGLNNMALVFGSAAFVSIIGSCTPATTWLVELVRYRTTTLARTVGVAAVCFGTMLCVHGELHFSVLSLVLASSACFCRSLKTVWSHDLMEVDLSAYRLAAWSSIWSFFIMMIPCFIKEGTKPWASLPHMSTRTALVLAASCAAATWLNIVMCFVLKYLGPVQQNVFGQLELLAVIVLAIIWLHETVSFVEWVGVTLIIGGCVLTKLDDKVRKFIANLSIGLPGMSGQDACARIRLMKGDGK